MQKINAIQLSIGAILALSLCANALNLEEVTVTATQNSLLKVDKAPVLVDVLTEEFINQKNITSIGELFKHSSGIDAKTAGPGSVMPIIRGLSHEQVLVLVDGVRLSDERPGGNHVLSVDPAQVQRVEFVKGPGSVLYGAGAIGGVVNFITKKESKENSSDEFKVNGDLGLGYSSNNSEKLQKFSLQAASKDISLYAGVSNKDSDNLKDSDGNEINYTFYDGHTIWGGGDIRFGAWKAGLNLWQSIADIGITAPKNFIEDNYKDEKHTMINSDLSYASLNTLLKKFDLKLGWQKHTRHRVIKTDDSKLIDIYVDKETKTLRGQFVFVPNSMYRITTGMDLFDEDLTSTRAMKNFPPAIGKFDGVPVMAPSSRDGIGAFVQNEIKVDDYTNITAGLRYDKIKSTTDGSKAPYFITSKDSDTDSSFSGSLGIVYQLSKVTNMYTNIGRAFRAPTIIERYYHGPHDGPAQDRGNPNLNPEKSINTDFGFRFKGDNYVSSFGLFYNEVDNLIKKVLINPTEAIANQIYQYQNISKAKLYGGEFDIEYFIDDSISLFGSLSYTKGKDVQLDRPLTAISPLKAKYGLIYDSYLNRYPLSVEVSGESVKRQNKIGVGEKVTPGYSIYNLRANLLNFKDTKISLSAENIFNKKNYDHLSYSWQKLGNSSMGRNIKFNISYKF